MLLDLLQVLHKHTDEDHPIKQNEIINLLEKEHGYEKLYRKTVKKNIDKLMSYSEYNDMYEIQATPSIRERGNKQEDEQEEITVYSDFIYEHEFTHEELYLIIDGILFSKHIPGNQREELIEKLEKLTSKYFESRLSRIRTMQSEDLENKQLFFNIKIIDEAISHSKQISFYYNNYTVNQNSNLVLEARKDQEGIAREYVINPYEMVAHNGRYYLICNNDKYNNLSHYRLDRITQIKKLDTNRKRAKDVEGLSEDFDLSKHMQEHIYMFAGETIRVKIRLNKYIIGEFIDWFGTDDIDFFDQTENEVTVSVRVNRTAMRKWALQYAIHVKVLSPTDLVEEIKADINLAMQNYKGD